MLELNGGAKDNLEIYPNLWAGVGLVRGGAGTAMVGSYAEIADLIEAYRKVGVEEFVLSGYPHLEEAYRVAELLFPALGIDTSRKTLSNKIANEFTVGHHGREQLAAG